MQGPHRTILTYFYGELDSEGDCPQLEVGEVTCVPRPKDEVYIADASGKQLRYIVDKVTWAPDTTAKSITWVAVDLDGPYPSNRTKKAKTK